MEAVPHQVIATYTLSNPLETANLLEKINSKLTKIKERLGKETKAGKDKVDVEVTQSDIAVNLLVTINVDDEAAAATARSKLPRSEPIERLWGGEKERKIPGMAALQWPVQVEPPINRGPLPPIPDSKVKAQVKVDKAWKPVPGARYTEGECKYLADKAIEVLWEKVREQQRRLDPSASSLLSPTAPSPSPSLPQVKQRRCDPLREYLDEIPPKSAAAVGTALTDDIFSKPLETAKVGKDETVKPETVKDEELTNKVKAKPGPGTVDQEPLKKVKDAVDEIER